MLSIISIAFLSALAFTGIITVLFIALHSSPVRFEALHWIAAIICVVASSIFLAGAFGAARTSKLVNRTADVVNGYSSDAVDILKDYIPEEFAESGDDLKSLADGRVETARQIIRAKLRKAVIWAVTVTVVLNGLYLVLLAGTCPAGRRRYSYSDELEDSLDGDYGSLSGGFDDIDDEL